jgi:hypothetical protein
MNNEEFLFPYGFSFFVFRFPFFILLFARTGRDEKRSAQLPAKEAPLDPPRLIAPRLDHLPGPRLLAIALVTVLIVSHKYLDISS